MKRKLIHTTTAFICLILLLIGVATGLYLNVKSYIKTPRDSQAADRIFVIQPGQSFSAIADALEREKIISNSRIFKFYARYKGLGEKLQTGEYVLSGSRSPKDILGTLLMGKVKLYKITIPEGLNIIETAGIVETAGFCNKETFVFLCKDPGFIHSLDIQASTLEGYLFPDTYFFPKHSGCQTIIKSMVRHFHQIFTTEWEERANKLGFSVFEIVTLASIIEKETGDASERSVISSVFHNRMKKNMRLESDPTVIYGIKNFDGNIKKKHLRIKTPYNTYQIKGLPLGPIANPGEKALEAALYPDSTPFLFFVSKKDTTHHFSKTIQEHNRAVRKYQLGKEQP